MEIEANIYILAKRYLTEKITNNPDELKLSLTLSERRQLVRGTLQIFAQAHPGRSVEVRVVPDAAVQAIAGQVHRRGTPPNVVEMSPEVWIDLAFGCLDWETAMTQGKLEASGTRADLSAFLPLISIKDAGKSAIRGKI